MSYLTKNALTYQRFAGILGEYGLSVKNVIYDSNRRYDAVYYADYNRGIYGGLALSEAFPDAATTGLLMVLGEMQANGNELLIKKDYYHYYGLDKKYTGDAFKHPGAVPLPMLNYDFSKRMYEIHTSIVFDVWLKIYKRIDRANGMWNREILDYVFQYRPVHTLCNEKEPVVIYRGMATKSTPANEALSWSTSPVSALNIVCRTGAGSTLLKGTVAPEDIITYTPGIADENEVIVLPGTVSNIIAEEMIPGTTEAFSPLFQPTVQSFLLYAKQALSLGYPEEGYREFHGIKHILRVLILALLYMEHSGDNLSDTDKKIVIQFALLHDIGRDNEDADPEHGDKSLQVIVNRPIKLKGFTKTDMKILRLIIKLHCIDDEEGEKKISSRCDLSAKHLKRALHLYALCKDVDALDRTRFGGLDYRYLRTPFAKKLPMIAGYLTTQNILAVVKKHVSE